MNNQHLQVKQLACIRGDRHLFSELDIRLDSGQLLYLQGRNGSGKTTLLRTLCGLFHPDEGEVLWCGKKVTELGELFYKDVLFVGHAPGIKLELTPLENLRIYTRLHELDVAEDALWQALQDIGLRGFEDLPARMLSAGQKRRIALARLLIDKAALWILDEPFTALDVVAVDLLQAIIAQHVSRGGMVILTTHQEVQLPDHQVQRLKLGD